MVVIDFLLMGLNANFIQKQLIPWVFYFALISLVRLRFDFSLLSWWMGGGLAVGFMVFERLLHFLWLHPELETSQTLAAQIKSKKYGQLLRLISSQQLPLQRVLGLSVLFLGSWLVLAIFIVSSSNSFLAKGMVMGIGLRPLLIIIKHWNHPQVLADTLLWQIKRELSPQEIRTLAGIFSAVFCLLSLWLMVS